MGKKFITERKWNKLFDQLDADLYEKSNPDGSRTYTSENFDEYLKRIESMPDYQIIGLRHQFNVMKERIYAFRLKHLKLGKLVYSSAENSFTVGNISKDIHWQMNRILLIVIRDYLRSFISKTPAIGNCVLRDNPEGLPYREALLSKEIDFNERWITSVNMVADEFDSLRLMIEKTGTGEFPSEDKNGTVQEQIDRAFKDLAYIFRDLDW